MKKILSLIMVMLLMFGAMPMSFAVEDNTNATIIIAGDDRYDLYVNGALIASPQSFTYTDAQATAAGSPFRVTLEGNYSIAIKGQDTHKYIAGVGIVILFDDGEVITAGENWSRFVPSENNSVPEDWFELTFDDSAWVDAFPILNERRDPQWKQTYAYNEETFSLPWMWSENFKQSDGAFDTEVYFRYSVTVEEEEEEGSNNDPSNEDPEPEQPPTPTEPAGPQANVTVNYVDSEGNTLLPSFVFSGTVGTNYVTTARTVDGFELVETPSNASGSFVEGGVVINYVYSDGTEEVVEEDTPLGAPAFDLDSIYVDEPTEEETTEAVEEVVLDEATPLADALPQTGQATPELFFGLGGLISTAGLMLKRKNK